jgi:hypothetical protein
MSQRLEPTSLRPKTEIAAGILMAAIALAAGGCSRGPAAMRQPAIDAAAAGRDALDRYDTDGNGVIAGTELDAAPSLKAALARLDIDKDGGVSAAEVAERVRAWKAMLTGLASVRCHVTLDGKPLAGARVVLEPEPFLGTHVKAASGDTNPFGDVSPSVAPEDLPDPSLPGGVHFGLYRVRISKEANGRETIPARYNAETVLGQEIAYDDPGMVANDIRFRLESRP